MRSCGGCCGVRFSDINGNECNTSLKDRTVSIELEQFKKIPRKITLASGVEKAYAIMAAVKGGLIDTLIIDSRLGTEMIDIWKTHQGTSD